MSAASATLPRRAAAWAWLPLAQTLMCLAVLLYLTVSANLLTRIGFPYVTDGGPLPAKIHPATYVLVIAWGISRWRQGGFWRLAWRQGELAWFAAAMVFCLADCVVLSSHDNAIVLMDGFLPALCAASWLADAPDTTLATVRRWLRGLFFANAGLALLEAATRSQLIPLYLNDAAYAQPAAEFRPTALYDHPLTGAAITLIGVLMPPARRQGLWRATYLLVLSAGLMAFGGRMALAAGLLAGLFLAVRRRRMPSPASLLGGVLGLLLLLGLLASGTLGGRLAEHFYWDPSAQTRLTQWAVLDRLSISQLVFGCPRPALIAILAAMRLQSGVGVIENFWLVMALNLGLFGFPVFVAGFVALCRFCALRTGVNGKAMLVCVLVIASTSNSLARKSPLLPTLVVAMACARPGPRLGPRHI